MMKWKRATLVWLYFWLQEKLHKSWPGVEVIVGLMWGDEGKGAEIYRLCHYADLVVRCFGGNNAGHTIVVCDPLTGEDGELILHLLPSSLVWGHEIAMGAGVVVDPVGLINEVKHARSFNIDPSERLSIDGRCALVLVYHRVLDLAEEIVRARSGEKIDTTARGIGPAYADLVNRKAIRMSDAKTAQRFENLLRKRLAEKGKILVAMGLTKEEWADIFVQLKGKEESANKRLIKNGLLNPAELDYTRFAGEDPGAFKVDEILKFYLSALNEIKSWGCIRDVSRLVNGYIKEGKKVWVEGAQGAHLDNYFGTFPFVTSSHTLSGGACIGIGMSPRHIKVVRGILKAFTTRVGNGAFPTRVGDALRYIFEGTGLGGREVGATTGRTRGVGWLDLVLTRTACMINGVTVISLTKLDILSGKGTLKICVAWRIDGVEYDFVPDDHEMINRAEPIYIEVPGWIGDISQVKSWEELPRAARYYVETVEILLNKGAVEPIKIDRLGVGAKLEQVILR